MHLTPTRHSPAKNATYVVFSPCVLALEELELEEPDRSHKCCERRAGLSEHAQRVEQGCLRVRHRFSRHSCQHQHVCTSAFSALSSHHSGEGLSRTSLTIRDLLTSPSARAGPVRRGGTQTQNGLCTRLTSPRGESAESRIPAHAYTHRGWDTPPLRTRDPRGG